MNKKECIEMLNNRDVDAGFLRRLLYIFIDEKDIKLSPEQKEIFLEYISFNHSLREAFLRKVIRYFCIKLNITEVYSKDGHLLFFV